MKFLTFAASLRQESVNKKLIHVVNHAIKQEGHTVDAAMFDEFCGPLYNADDQNQSGFPQPIQDFVARLQASDGLVIASPEYNYSTPGTLKNLIDWVSRIAPQPWRSQRILLLSASPSLVGGNRGLWHTRVPLEACGAFVYPDMFSLADAYSAFAVGESVELMNEDMQKRLQETIRGFASYCAQFK